MNKPTGVADAKVRGYLLTRCDGKAWDIKTDSLANRVKELEFEMRLAKKRIHQLEIELEHNLLETRQNGLQEM